MQQRVKPESFLQFVFDNADFDVNTLDGKNTFHSMGGIQIVTPENCFPKRERVKRFKKRLTRPELDLIEKIPFHIYENIYPAGYKSIEIENFAVPEFGNANV